MARFLVTGAAGFIGSQLAEAIVQSGDDVVGLDCFTDGYPRPIKDANLAPLATSDQFELLESDLASADLTELVAGVDGVFHLAATPGVRSSWGQDFDVYLHNNLLATQRLFAICAQAGTRVVFASSSSVYGDSLRYPTTEAEPARPIAPYGVTKLAGEHLAHAFSGGGLDVVILRYFTVYGPRQRPDMAFTRIARALLRDEVFEVYGDGTQTRDVTYVGDVVAATRRAMEVGRSGAIYNVGGGHETSLLEVIALFEAAADRRLQCQFVDRAAGDARRTASDTTLIAEELGWTPRTDLGPGIANHFSWAAKT